MATVNGEVVNLHKLELDDFVLMDGTLVSPLQIRLDDAEMNAMVGSGQSGVLLEKYEPVSYPDHTVGFKLRGNHSRNVFRRERRELMKKREVEK